MTEIVSAQSGREVVNNINLNVSFFFFTHCMKTKIIIPCHWQHHQEKGHMHAVHHFHHVLHEEETWNSVRTFPKDSDTPLIGKELFTHYKKNLSENVQYTQLINKQ